MSGNSVSEGDQIAAEMAERPKLYYRVTFPHVSPMVLDPGELESVLAESDDKPMGVEKIYLTDAEYEALPEFES